MIGDTDGTERTGKSSEPSLDLVGLGRADLDGSGDILELLFLQGMIASHQHECEGPVEHVDERLDLAVRSGDLGKRLCECGDGADLGRGEALDSRR